jgi:superfamily II DNA or RNA helicase
MVKLRFSYGTIEVHGFAEAATPHGCMWDPRSGCHRAPAIAYAEVVRSLLRDGVQFIDEARQYEALEHGAAVCKEPRSYQIEALRAWLAHKARGVVVLPTGAGKSQVAVMAIEEKRRATLVIAPTLDLVRQWYDLLRMTFQVPVGVLGGGEYDVQRLTVSTYDSAYLHMERLGDRFGLVVFDECHHLPSASYAMSARCSLAPFRLGLTATPPESSAPGEWSATAEDGREAELSTLVGPIVFRKDIVDLRGHYLAEYDTERIAVELSPLERAEYEKERAIYRGFVEQHGIRMSSPTGWREFILRSSSSFEGRRAMQAYRRQRELALCAPAKLDFVHQLLERHRADRTILFTQDNATCYAVSRRFLVPAITHQTKVRERSEILAGLAEGRYGAVVTSKVLNEGVDIPDANVAIVISGSGSVREHVQRLGRILRKREGKRALLYELVTSDTSESFTSERRREHIAYR